MTVQSWLHTTTNVIYTINYYPQNSPYNTKLQHYV